jgi:hypothetical protein
LIKVTDAALKKAEYAQKVGSEEYRALARLRNGVEGIPSVLRRRFGVDRMRDKGVVRKRQRFGFKMMAINVDRLFGWLRNTAEAVT